MNRRGFLQVSLTAGGGLLLGFDLFGCKSKKSEQPATPRPVPIEPRQLEPQTPPTAGSGADLNAWIRIDPDGKVTLFIPEAEMGQGVLTSLPMILADELAARWEDVSAVNAPLDEAKYGRQSTGGSTSIRTGIDRLRHAGAAARAMLIAAAAAEWKVAPSECVAADGTVTHPAGKSAGYGELVGKAATIEPPDEPVLMPDDKLRYIGKPMPRLDIPSKTDGSAVFGMDVRVPDMVYASVEHCPIFGGSLKAVDDAAARKVPGVRDVVRIPTGVAVVADHTWAAFQGRKALKVTWDDGGYGTLSSDEITKMCVAAAKSGAVARNDGHADKAIAGAEKKLEAIYQVPYLAHAPMEPMSCTARVGGGQCEVWAATQTPSGTGKTAAEITGFSADKIQVHQTLLGGGFGRRSQTDFVADAVHLAKQIGKPVKVVWEREDDVRGGWYRPTAYNVMSGAVGAGGLPVAWSHRIASPSILKPMMGSLKDGIDGASVEGAANVPYAMRDVFVSYANVELPISVWWWRSVGSSQNAYVTECFFDELCALGGADPYEARRKLLAKRPRHRAVLEAAATRAGWGTPVPEGRARGIAVHEAFGSFVAQVAEVSLEGGKPRVHRVVCAVDCGKVVNPDTIVAQMESGIAYGLTAALYGEISIDGGRAVPGNFDTYKILRMAEMPAVETHLVPSGDAYGGIGEPGLPPIAPSVCNALRALTGKPVRSLPIKA